MSVVAMAIIDWVVDRWMFSLWTTLAFSSYVDNWELSGSAADQIVPGIQSLHAICEGVDIELDSGKTYTWPLDAAADFRAQGFVTKLGARNLGGHMQHSRRHTNYTITARCGSLQGLWGRLGKSLASPSSEGMRLVTSSSFGLGRILGGDSVASWPAKVPSLNWFALAFWKHPALTQSFTLCTKRCGSFVAMRCQMCRHPFWNC